MDSIQISVIHYGQPKMDFHLLPNDRIRDLKQMIRRRMGGALPNDAGFSLIYLARILEDERTVQDCHIENGSTVIVMRQVLR
jgi:hypothetical protein